MNSAFSPRSAIVGSGVITRCNSATVNPASFNCINVKEFIMSANVNPTAFNSVAVYSRSINSLVEKPRFLSCIAVYPAAFNAVAP